MTTLRMSVVTVAVVLLSLSAQAAQPEKRCEVLEPGKRLGDRYSLGTTLKADSAVVADAIPGWYRPSDLVGIAVRLRFDADKRLVEFDAPLPACVQLGARRLDVPNVHVLAAALGTCGVEKVNEGGTVIECAGVKLVTTGGAAFVRVFAPAPACTTYVTGKAWFDAAGAHPGAELVVGDRAVCVANLDAVLGAKTSLAEFKTLGLTCREEAARGATQVTCGETTYTFAGPTLLLSRLSFAK